MWLDIVSILFVCVAANHLGLVEAIEKVSGRKLSIVNCPKCFSFWCTLAYCLWETKAHHITSVLAISFLNAYLALWLELGMGFIDYIYNKVYETIYESAADNTPATDPDADNSAGSMPEL